jgi:hypothetical protein
MTTVDEYYLSYDTPVLLLRLGASGTCGISPPFNPAAARRSCVSDRPAVSRLTACVAGPTAEGVSVSLVFAVLLAIVNAFATLGFWLWEGNYLQRCCVSEGFN